VRIVFLGLSITSSWGNGHATNYRALLEALAARGHAVIFLERDADWYAAYRDFDAPYVRLYRSFAELREKYVDAVRGADLVVIGSFVPEGAAIGEWVTATADGLVAFWDLDTPVTAAKLALGDHDYLTPDLLERYDVYLSFTGGPLLERLGARRPHPFHCMVDAKHYRPVATPQRYLLGYLGTYSADRQEALERLLVEPARRLSGERFVIAGPRRSPGRPTWSASSTCRPSSIRTSTPRNGSR
jgi:spore maturation protein CgeB